MQDGGEGAERKTGQNCPESLVNVMNALRLRNHVSESRTQHVKLKTESYLLHRMVKPTSLTSRQSYS